MVLNGCLTYGERGGHSWLQNVKNVSSASTLWRQVAFPVNIIITGCGRLLFEKLGVVKKKHNFFLILRP
jgi:hypothetical protein